VADVPGGFLPSGHVQVDVKPDTDTFTVTLRAESVAKNIELLRRAKALAAPRTPSGV